TRPFKRPRTRLRTARRRRALRPKSGCNGTYAFSTIAVEWPPMSARRRSWSSSALAQSRGRCKRLSSGRLRASTNAHDRILRGLRGQIREFGQRGRRLVSIEAAVVTLRISRFRRFRANLYQPARTAAFELGPRLGPANFERQSRRRPTVRPLGVPVDVAIAKLGRALRRVPGHPAIAQAIEYDRLIRIVAGRLLKFGAKIRFHDWRERSISGVRQPQAARDIDPPLVAPDDLRTQIGGTGRLRQNIDKGRIALIPDLARFVGRQDAGAVQGRRRRRAIILHAIGLEFGRRFVRKRGEGREPSANHGDRESRAQHASVGYRLVVLVEQRNAVGPQYRIDLA